MVNIQPEGINRVIFFPEHLETDILADIKIL